MGRQVRLVDLARAARASVSTVARALKGRPDASPATRARVRRIAARMGYTPNGIARSLVSQRSETIGLVVNDCTNPFFSVLIESIQQAAEKRGYALILCTSGEREEREAEAVRVLLQRRVDGLLIVPVGGRAGRLRPLLRNACPFVLMCRHLSGLRADLVANDNRRAGLILARHLIEADGHDSVAHISGDSRISSVREIAEGVRLGLHRAGRHLEPRWVVPASRDLEGGYAAGKRLAKLLPRPSAVVAFNDLQAIGAMRAFEEEGLRVPADVAVAGNNDIAFAPFASVPLTTVIHPVAAIGQVAVDRLVDRVEGRVAGPPQRVLLQPELRIRRSCGCPAPEGAA
jgi:LacI family transcriptional regulator